MLRLLIFLHGRVRHLVNPEPLFGLLILFGQRAVSGKKTGECVAVDPDLVVSFLLGLVKDQLEAEMEMDGFDVVGVFHGAVARMPHIADHVSGGYDASLLQVKGVGEVLPQVCVIVIALFVKAADSDPPSPVLVPAKGLHIAGFHGHYGSPDPAHHVMAKMGASVAIAAGRAKIIVIIVFKSLRNRGEGFQSINLFPDLSSVSVVLLDLIFPHHAAQNGFVGLIIIFIIFHILRQLFQSGRAIGKFPGQLVDQGKAVLVKGASAFCPGVGQKLDPVQMHFLAIALHIQRIGL